MCAPERCRALVAIVQDVETKSDDTIGVLCFYKCGYLIVNLIDRFVDHLQMISWCA